MYCPSCGNMLQDGFQFCPRCGKAIQLSVEAKPPANPPTASQIPQNTVPQQPNLMQNAAQQSPPVEPAQVKAKKKRHGCLTTWLIIMIIGAVIVAIINLLGFSELQTWQLAAFIAIGILEVVFVIALFNWKRWGFWGICALAVITVIINLSLELGPTAFSGLIGVVLLYAVLQIGGENKGWKQLE